MKTIQEYLSGQHNEELRVLVAEARGWECDNAYIYAPLWKRPGEGQRFAAGTYPPLFSTSLDACRELLEDLTMGEWGTFQNLFREDLVNYRGSICQFWLTRTALQICVAYLIVKGILK